MRTPKKKGIGRPPLPEGVAKAIMFTVRMMPNERESISRAAETGGISSSEWARRVLVEAAQRA